MISPGRILNLANTDHNLDFCQEKSQPGSSLKGITFFTDKGKEEKMNKVKGKEERMNE